MFILIDLQQIVFHFSVKVKCYRFLKEWVNSAMDASILQMFDDSLKGCIEQFLIVVETEFKVPAKLIFESFFGKEETC